MNTREKFKLYLEKLTIVELIQIEEQLTNFYINKIKDKDIDTYNLKYEELYTSEYITPEIFSFIEELKLAKNNIQYSTSSYYTSKEIVNLILNETILKNKYILEPSCGSGNFLINIILKLYEEGLYKNKQEFLTYLKQYIYCVDLNSNSFNLIILRINCFLKDKFNETMVVNDYKYINFYEKDFLIDFYTDIKFNIIVGNPPYLGTKSMKKDYLMKIKKIFNFTDDLYSLFIFKSSQLIDKEDFYFSFITSNTYFTIKSKEKLRTKLKELNLYKIIDIKDNIFNIFTNTAIFYTSNLKKKEIFFHEMNKNKIEFKNSIKYEKNNFTINNSKDDINLLFENSIKIYNKYKNNIQNSKSLSKFINTNEYKEIFENNRIIPLGLIVYVATGIDFAGNNDKALYSISNKKYNLIDNVENIKYDIDICDFKNGLEDKKYIKAIKGNEELFILWDKEFVSYLKQIKAPLRNINMYNDSNLIYFHSTKYSFKEIDKNTIAINTAGSGFLKPISNLNINIKKLIDYISNEEIKHYLKTEINNSRGFTPENFKLIPIELDKVIN